jgi:hypothetical protein
MLKAMVMLHVVQTNEEINNFPQNVLNSKSEIKFSGINSHLQWRTQEFYSGGGVQQIQLRTERTGSGGSGPLVRGSGGSCNLVQQISFHIVKFS